MNDEQLRAAANVSVTCPDHGALPGERCTPTTRACPRRKAVVRDAQAADRSARDDATVRATMRHYAPRGLVTLDDFAALPGVAGAQDHPGEGKVTVYRERGLPLAALEHLQHDVDERKTLNLLVAWKVDRRQAERRRSASPDGPPPIPSEARWA